MPLGYREPAKDVGRRITASAHDRGAGDRHGLPALVILLAIGVVGAAGCGPSANATLPAAAVASSATTSATPSPMEQPSSSASVGGSPAFSPSSTVVPLPSTQSATGRLPGEPDPLLTPGALNPAVTQVTIGSTICVSGWTSAIRPSTDYTNALKVQQIAEYGYTDTSTADYEEDHLIPLELGGAPTDERNLWPEPHTARLPDGRPAGSNTKDVFETQLKNGVCAGDVTLAQAQLEIGDSWVHFYYGIPLGGGLSPSPSPAQTASIDPALFSVKITSLPSSVRPGVNATIAAATSPGAACSVKVVYASGTVSTAKGLAPIRTAGSTGKVSWTWTVGTRTGAGTATAAVECSLGDRRGSDSRTFQVT